jgi:hypothetical protein
VSYSQPPHQPKTTHSNAQQTGADAGPLFGYAQEEDAPNNTKITSCSQHKPEKWSDIPLKDRLLIWLTGGIVAVAAITAFVLIRQSNIMQGQLDEMQGSGQQTERMAILAQGQMVNAAREAENTKLIADATQSAMLIDQRPWVGPRRYTRPPQESILQLQPRLFFTAVLANTGKTPALHVETRAHTRLMAFKEDFQPLYEGTYLKASSGYILPEGELIMPIAYDFKADEVRDIISNPPKRIFYFYGLITYRDPLQKPTDPPHKTTFCMLLMPDLSALASCDRYNDAE